MKVNGSMPLRLACLWLCFNACARGREDPCSALQVEESLQAAAAAMSRGELEVAHARILDLLKVQPQMPRAHYFLGVIEYRRARFQQARRSFETALESPGDFPERRKLFQLLGWSLLRLGDLEAARRCFHRHLELEPQNPETRFGLGRTALESGRADEALSEFQRSLELESRGERRDQRLAKYHRACADALAALDRLEEARTHLEIAAALLPEHYSIHYRLYQVLKLLGEDGLAEKARRDFEARRPALLDQGTRPGSADLSEL